MTYIVWFNRKYRRQFEVVVKQKTWKEYKEKWGTLIAAMNLIADLHRVKSKRRKTPKRERSAGEFIVGSHVRPDIFGTPMIKIGKSKKAVLEKHSEIIMKGVKQYAGTEKSRHRLR